MKQILCIKLVKYWDKYAGMHGQQNVKIFASLLEQREFIMVVIVYYCVFFVFLLFFFLVISFFFMCFFFQAFLLSWADKPANSLSFYSHNFLLLLLPFSLLLGHGLPFAGASRESWVFTRWGCQPYAQHLTRRACNVSLKTSPAGWP